MKRKSITRSALFTSIISLLLCISMLVGTTFAWFTDSVKSGINTIAAGVLDVEMEYLTNGEWKKVDETTKLFDENALWEPGHTEVAYLRISNAGDLALKYQLGINIANQTGSVNKAGESFMLSDHIVFGVLEDVQTPYATREEARDAVTTPNPLTAGYAKQQPLLPGDEPDCVALVVYMPENVGNEANYATGHNPPKIELGIKLTAAQQLHESDSFGNDYDIFAEFPKGTLDISVAAPVVKAEDGTTTTAVKMGGAGTGVSAAVPQGVAMADDAAALSLTVKTMAESGANITMTDDQISASVDVHMAGVAEGNTVPMIITLERYLPGGINTGALALYHVENGTPVAMTQVAEPVNHNEFSYDPLTGDVKLALASFSEIAVIADTNNTWDGKSVAITRGDGSANNPYMIASAGQLAYFRDQVDAGEMTTAHVKLNNNIFLSGVNFDPIGWGYVNTAWNSSSADGKVFQGTFDGNNKTISDLYQNGWDLEAATGTDYTYTNCGFGLFAAASGATFKDLTMYGADIKAECVEMGVLVGLSQGNCTYENINIYNSKIANYQRPTGGLIGEVSPLNGGGETKITNVEIGSDVVVGSLWGDFDAPCGGVIGARWDDSNTTTVKMKDVKVGCRMDVYSDVTSAYQWYAYRRAGMLMGNTEQTAENNQHLAAARFLTCENVKVYYGTWAAYHYCQFTNQDNEWQNNYPWVRVEAGENCSAYSNPRYGQPVINGTTVSTDAHTCTDEHKMELRFNQLYGGGQGVYGQPAHDGVDVVNYRYSITYVNDYEVLAIKYVTETGAVSTANSAAQDLVEKWAAENITGTWKFGGWMNAGSTKLTQIDADNKKDIVLYPYFNKPYTARFMDQQGNVVAYCFFHKEDLTKLDATKDEAQGKLPNPGTDFEFDYWEVNANGSKVQYSKNNFANYEYDVTIYPVYKYTGNLKLTPVDEDNDGTIDYYKVEAVDALNTVTTIPGNVNGVPVKLVEKLYKNDNNWDFGSGVTTIIIEEGVEELARNSLGYTKNLSTVKLPNSLKTLGKNVFSRNTGDDEKSITIEFNGTMAEWNAVSKNEDWHNGLETGTKVICTDGYFELKAEEYLWGAYETYEWTAHPNS